MPNKNNIASVEKITEELKAANAMWVVDYRGLTVKEAEVLRRAVREAGGHMNVHKNTLVKLALKGLDQPTLDDILAGPSAFIFADGDPVAAAKVVKEYAKDNEKMVIKGGVMEGSALTADDVEAIASLPSREQLYGQIAGAISGMARGLAVALSGLPRGLAVATAAVAEQKDAA
ncbi:50S ribosomal protein L10 [Slackia heliotrinireducens]|uniref:Large ribosomal subunit protein uL10 n=1 Tax=Slackia heliotrinireducens (strain ATCC 29202 / DSM 20476 / NCTC 11029 / RHS 1) TaxID=471855 RepID=C7N4R1_SLAHD|nr:50S ribosomal protein L10 [Slackia heliotrinireducens]ACV21896.1 ribosomal protein L10 [Slackia heliotrinireducens DSM 20476]VEG99690.1 50S ribosomal protein L10 [Slackia heliotrinireducens]